MQPEWVQKMQTEDLNVLVNGVINPTVIAILGVMSSLVF